MTPRAPRPLLVVALVLAAGCASRWTTGARKLRHDSSARAAEHDAFVGAAPAPPPTRDDGRLPNTASPRHYTLSLDIDPSRTRFSGSVEIEVDVPQPTWHLVLHGRDLRVSRATARVGQTEMTASMTTRLAHGGVVPEELVLRFPEPLPAGSAVLALTYDAPFAPGLAGLYRVEQDGRSYAYSQFEATDARRAFPCFDEPGFKTPYDVTIAAPRGDIVLTNAPESAREDGPGEKVTHHFRSSPPLPTYLVAFAIGDFDIAEGQREPFPIRVITTKGGGRTGQTALALEAAAALVPRLADYFGAPYPYEKLDLVAVPDFAAGAMENPGLVTFRDVLLLLDATQATTAARRSQAEVIAHELAHQWFGDLVTLEWWDDLWLNEAFATWAESKIVDAWRPSFGATFAQIAGVQRVMDVDALESARAVREPVRSTSEAEEAFDGITYEKGAAILRMLESWLGQDTFRRGVQRYVHEHAWKNARAEDLFQALEYVSTQKVGRMASGFLDRPGVPNVIVSWSCGAVGGTRLDIHASEWRALSDRRGPGAAGGGVDAPSWTIPVCVNSDVEKNKSCFMLGAEPIARDLGAKCPAWLNPNADAAGYYRFLLDASRLRTLARALPGPSQNSDRTLSPIERLALLANAWAAVRQGALAPPPLADLLRSFDLESNRFVVEQIASILYGIDASLVDDADRPAFERYVGARMGGHKNALGWQPAAGVSEEDSRALERRTVLTAMGELANDPGTLDEAERFAVRWLKDPASVPADIAATAVPLASLQAGYARLYELRAAATDATTVERRVLAIRAMGMFQDPAILRSALDLTLTDELKISEVRYLLGSAIGHRSSRPTVFAWEREKWDQLRARLSGASGRSLLVDVAGGLCTAAEVEEATAFFGEATRGMEGVKRRLDQALEQARLCVTLRQSDATPMAKYLSGR
ncbi:MAG: M1 family metallopeptidase [Myxococcota bacterium]|nr:M1 family metallopeptidase [Myxococcota bacterium]